MSVLAFIAGETGLADLGYRFFDSAGDWVGARVTAGITEQDAAKGSYLAASATIPGTAKGVHWDSTGTPEIQGDEIFDTIGFATIGEALSADNIRIVLGDPANASNLASMLNGTGGLLTAIITGGIFGDITGNLVGGVTGDVTGSVGAVATTVNANVVQISGDNAAADVLEAILDGTGGTIKATITGNLNGNVVGNVQGNVLGGVFGDISGDILGAVTTFTEGAITAFAIAPDAIGASELAASAVSKIAAAITGSTDWTADEKTAIRAILGVPSSGSTPEVPSAGALKVIDDLIDTEIAALPAAINTALSSQHGSGSWEDLGGTGLDGPSPVTLTFVDSLGAPIPSVEFTVIGQGFGRATTAGVAAFGLAPGSYSVVSRNESYVLFPLVTLVVTTSGSATIVGQYPAQPSPSPTYAQAPKRRF